MLLDVEPSTDALRNQIIFNGNDNGATVVERDRFDTTEGSVQMTWLREPRTVSRVDMAVRNDLQCLTGQS